MSGYGDIQRQTDGRTDGPTGAITKDPVRLKTGVQNKNLNHVIVEPTNAIQII